MHFIRVLVVTLVMVLNIALVQATTAVKVTKEVIFKSITNLSGSLNKKTAWLYADIIQKYSSQYDVDPLLVVAIAKHEGDFVLNKKNGYYKDTYEEDGSVLKQYVVTDYCMMQINKSNLARLRLNTKKLLNDPDYCIKTGVKILASLKSFKKHDKNWWTRYNSPNTYHRAVYRKNILRYYKKASLQFV